MGLNLDNKNIFSLKSLQIALKSSLQNQKYFSDENIIHNMGLSQVKIIINYSTYES